MLMQRMLKIALTTAAFGLSAAGIVAPASAAVTLTAVNTNTTGTPDSYQIYGIGPTSGNPVYGSSPNNTTTPNVTFTAGVNTSVNISVNNGFAQLTPDTGTWTTLIIDPNLLFTDMKFAVSLVGSGTVNVYYLLANSGLNPDLNASYTQLAGSYSADGSNFNDEISGGTFDGIMLVASGSTFGTVKQVSYEPAPGAVPEPSTWAMMLLGFCGIGLTVRRRFKSSLMQLA